MIELLLAVNTIYVLPEPEIHHSNFAKDILDKLYNNPMSSPLY